MKSGSESVSEGTDPACVLTLMTGSGPDVRGRGERSPRRTAPAAFSELPDSLACSRVYRVAVGHNGARVRGGLTPRGSGVPFSRRCNGDRSSVGEAMGKHSKPAYELAEADGPARDAPAMPDAQLSGYRAAVDDLVTEAIRKLGLADPPAAGEFVGERLSRGQFAPILSRLNGGPHAAALRLVTELRRFRPSDRGAGDVWSFARIMLLSQIDSVWWGETAPFSTDADVMQSAELGDLPPLKAAGVLRFQYREQPTQLA